MSIEKYIKRKEKILEQLKIKLTKEERKKLRELKTEISIDNFCHSIICRD